LQRIYKILPKYAFLPLIICLGLNAFTYFGTRLFTTGLYHYDLSLPIDHMIPFTPFMMSVYVLAYVVWIVGFIVIGRESREVCYEVLTAEQIAKLCCLVAFIAIPTTIIRPEVTGTGFFQWLSRLIYSMDSPDNLLPSVHCLENWICFRGAMKCKKVGKGYKIFTFVAAILVFASTLMVKQHVVLDVVAAIVVVELGLFLSRRFNLSKIYFIIEDRLFKKTN
jgi:membrane-associated phospholipid phosphatase